MRSLFFIFVLFIFTSCTKSNRVFVSIHPFYKLYNYFEKDTNSITLTQKLKYNIPWVIDESFSKTLSIQINSPVLKTKLRLDTSIIKVTYNRSSTWQFGEEEVFKVKGWVILKKITANKIVIRESIKLKDLKYKGRRSFLTKIESDKRRKKRRR
jgi:hypothetical protein